jgi:hypothetical protein
MRAFGVANIYSHRGLLAAFVGITDLDALLIFLVCAKEVLLSKPLNIRFHVFAQDRR